MVLGLWGVAELRPNVRSHGAHVARMRGGRVIVFGPRLHGTCGLGAPSAFVRTKRERIAGRGTASAPM